MGNEWPNDVLACLDAMSVPLERKGFEPITPWWQQTIERFYRSPQRTLVGRVGRRGRKSSTWCRVAVAEILTGRHRIPPGDVGVVAVVSVDIREATERVRTMAAILDALGVEHDKPTQKGIEFKDRPYRISVFTASISGVSGFTCIFALGDEVAKWREGETKVNPAAEVLKSWRPTMLTMRDARMVLLSSPMGFDDAHAHAFAAGDGPSQLVAYAPTWLASPSVTEAMCRADAPTVEEFEREYAAIPQPGGDGAQMTDELLKRATRVGIVGREARDGKPWRPGLRGLAYAAVLDPCTWSPVWSLAVSTRRRCLDGKTRASIVLARQWMRAPDPEVVIRDALELLRGYGLEHAWTLPEAPAWAAKIGRRVGLSLSPTDAPASLYASMCLQLRDDGLELPDDPQLRADLLRARARPGASWELPRTPDGRHADYAPVVALAASKASGGPAERAPKLEPGTAAWWEEQERRDMAPEPDVDWVTRLARDAGYG
jgi:hypothetical protein